MTTKITLYNSWDYKFYGLPESLPELIERLTNILEDVPTELHDEVVCEFNTEEESSSVDIEIYYYREETPEEEAKRLNAEAVVLQAHKERKRREYEKLKSEFEP